MSASLDALVPDLIPFAKDLVAIAGEAGLQPRVTSTLRSNSEQKRLYADFLRGGRAYPVAPPGTSAHEYGLAFDMVVADHAYLGELGAVWQSMGGVWHPSDPIHFEAPDARARIASGDTIASRSTLEEAAVLAAGAFVPLPVQAAATAVKYFVPSYFKTGEEIASYLGVPLWYLRDIESSITLF